MLIGLTGFKKSGKDAFASTFVRHNFQVLRVADTLKEMLRTFYRMAGLSETDIERKIEGDLKEAPCRFLAGHTPRRAMQTLGTEWGQDMFFREIWSNIWKERVANCNGPVICPDIRFLHEEAALRDLGGALIRIDRPGFEPTEYHRSELEMLQLNPDITVVNDGTLDQLHKQAQELLHAHA